jgi:Na+-translocating ferredoxin:NAD+ oxidoreductase RnfD subunit
LIGTWLLAFVAQAYVRSILFGTPFLAGISPMTGVAFVLFSFYMITDPMTSPSTLRGQIVFGIALAAAYGALLVEHVIFTLFYAVFIVTAGRGLYLYVEDLVRERRTAPATAAAASVT